MTEPTPNRSTCPSRQHCSKLTAAQRARQCRCTMHERSAASPLKPFKVGKSDARFLRSLRIAVDDADRV